MIARKKKGGVSEDLVKQALQEAAKDRLECWTQRVYDSYSAGGAHMQAQAGDFKYVYRGHYGVIEVKSTAQDNRLPKKNFGDGQLARLNRLQMAGATAQVWVHHTKTDVWRHVPVDFLLSNFYECGTCWDLSKFEPSSVQELAVKVFQ